MKKIILFLFFGFIFISANELAIKQIKNSIKQNKNLLDQYAINIKYDHFVNYKNLKAELDRLNKKLDNEEFINKDAILRQIDKIEEELSLLIEYQDFNLSNEISKNEEIEILDKLTNPLAIISGFSHIKKLKEQKASYDIKFEEFKNIVKLLKNQNEDIERLIKLESNKENLQNAKNLKAKLADFKEALIAFNSLHAIYEKNINEEITRVKNDIKAQTIGMINIFIFIIISIAVAFVLKLLAKKYIKKDQQVYIINKIINFTNLSIILLILLFAYIENISYFVTILGFASAGLAIAMKDMFMSMLGWCVIVFGGSLKVGDRIKVWQNNTLYVGDIMDISFLRLTIYEDITLTTYTTNRRSGRVIFIPNNYIFTDLIANYTHHGIKTVWDGLDITLSFDSNHTKALEIIEQVVLKHSKVFTEMAKKSMRALRDDYSIKNFKVEPRFFMFFENYGMRISAWYMANAYSVLTLRSNISKELIIELNKHDDIKISYPSQNIYIDKKINPIKEELI